MLYSLGSKSNNNNNNLFFIKFKEYLKLIKGAF
jgi:hypothetical protein